MHRRIRINSKQLN